MRASALLILYAGIIHAAPVALFDGKTLAGWKPLAGEEKWWTVKDGAITGGSLTEKIPRNTFLTSEKSYQNFELTYQLRLLQGEGFQNSGLQIRSIRKPGSHEMIGYQVDAGSGYWGDLYDESRRAKLTGPLDPGALKAAVRDWDWNRFRVRCEGPRIRVWINDVLVTDFVEKDNAIPRDGFFGLQAHGGGKFLIQMKDILLAALPATPGAASWEKPDPNAPREPEPQRQSFVLPDGFTAELVASEAQGLNKPITVSWDRHGRMWTMTAVEYPVDANEDRQAAEALFAAGGRDRLLVFDEPNAPTLQTPRSFAEGLAIPLGVLPMKDGVLAQHGPEIRRYISESGTAATRHETVLKGFGIEDSHLFPHQFERPPGGWIYVAQGAFNRSQVRRPCGSPFACGNAAITFDHCKLARFKPDGSRFENLTGGPNNIWGLVISRLGETFIQEANDMGYPVAEFVPGTHYPTPFGPRMRDDAPILPPSTRGSQMGGTGLSGLALADDVHSPFANDPQGRQLFYLANPITNRIQTVSLARDANGHPIYEKGADFMLTDDIWFRPVAVHFGPDGCLYVVDWYNKIISHNEVPRSHPDRDKSRGRIWRIRHSSQSAPPRIDLAALADTELLPLLGGPNARLSMLAWNEIGDRKATALVPMLSGLATAAETPTARRSAALWALERLGAITPDVLLPAIRSEEPTLRFEAIRIAGETSLPEAEIMRLLEQVAAETHYRVRTAIIQCMRDHASPTPAMLSAAASLVRPPLAGKSRDSYDREFERYLVRWLLSGHPEATRGLLAAGSLPVEAALVAARSFDDSREAARLFTAILPQLDRPLLPAELTLLGKHLEDPQILGSLEALLAGTASRTALLRAMGQLAPETAARPGFASLVGNACARQMADAPSPENARLVIDLARRFRIAALADTVRPWMRDPARSPAEIAAGLAALREMAGAVIDDCLPFLDHADDGLRREAILALGSIADPAIISPIAARWPAMPAALRNLAVDGMVATPQKAEALATAVADGRFPDLDAASVEKILATLGPENPAAIRMRASRLEKPETRTPEQERLAQARFERFRALASQPGDIARGKRLAQTSCLMCHQVQGEGIAIGPDLSGAGAMGIDSLLRNILTPNEQLESGYYRHDIRLTDGTFASGFLASESAEALTLRRIGADDLVIPRASIASHQIAKRSLMPEGLIDGFTDQQVSDLFSYFLSLK
ncbi:MAG: DUF7133 domain-containing protein [Luteolibacter sp.]